MRPNIEEIWELSKEVDADNWEHTVLGENEQYITIGYKYENGIHQANWIAEIDNDEKESDEMYAIGKFIVSCAHNIPVLLAYIDELENMPLVQTVVKLQEENEHLHNELEVWKHATKTTSETIDSLRSKQEINQLNLDQEKIYKSVSTLENFLHDHRNGEFEWNEVTNVFGPNDAIALVNGIKIKDEIITRYMRIEQDLMSDCDKYEKRVEQLKKFLEDTWEVLRMERECE